MHYEKQILAYCDSAGYIISNSNINRRDFCYSRERASRNDCSILVGLLQCRYGSVFPVRGLCDMEKSFKQIDDDKCCSSRTCSCAICVGCHLSFVRSGRSQKSFGNDYEVTCMGNNLFFCQKKYLNKLRNLLCYVLWIESFYRNVKIRRHLVEGKSSFKNFSIGVNSA